MPRRDGTTDRGVEVGVNQWPFFWEKGVVSGKLVVWNMFLLLHSVGNVIIPIDEL